MGWGYYFVCNNCNKSYYVQLGYGGNGGWEMACRIEAGEFGEELKNAISTPGMYTGDGLKLYICDNCNYWETGPDRTIYVKDDGNQHLIKSEELNLFRRIPGMPGDPHLKMYKTIDCFCKKCGSTMRMYKEDLASITLACHECGKLNESRSEILWD